MPYTGSSRKMKRDYSTFYVKRCVALPGDTLSIVDGIYTVAGTNETIGYLPNQKRLQSYDGGQLKNMRVVVGAYPRENSLGWTIKDFGPFYIPKAGNSTVMTEHTAKAYKRMIEYETGQVLSIDSVICLDGIPLEQYVFEQNYYFMAGDYLFFSRDSRYWGVLPEDHFVGKVIGISSSKDPATNKYRFERFLKSVDIDD